MQNEIYGDPAIFRTLTRPIRVFDLTLDRRDAFFQRWRILMPRAGLRIAGKKLEHLQQLDRSVRKISACDCQFQAFPVSRHEGSR